MKKILFTVLPIALLLFTACLDEQESQVADEATAEIEATFEDAATGEVLADFDFFMMLEISGFSQPANFGEFTTDASGFFSSPVFSLTEDLITGVIVEYEVNGEIRSVEKEVELQLSFQDPINSVSLEFEIDRIQ